MRVTISNIVFEVADTPEGVAEMFARIDKALDDFQVYFSHLMVDGVEVRETPREHVEGNLTSIREVEVIFLSAEEYLQQVLTIIKTFIEMALPAMKEVAEEFYGKPDDSTWDRFTLALQGLQSLVEIVNSIISDPIFSGKVAEFDSIGVKLGEELHNLKDAAEKKDMTLVGDIMSYELVPFVESLHKAVEGLTNSPVTSPH